MKKAVVVTGASGFIGSAVMQALADDDRYEPVGVYRQEPDVADGTRVLVRPRFDSSTQWREALDGVDAIVHCAARVPGDDDGVDDVLELYRSVNVAGTLRLAREAIDAGVRRFILLSTVKVSGEESGAGTALDEQVRSATLDPYAQSKFEAEDALLDLTRNTSLEAVIVRPVLVYGPRVKGNFREMMSWLHTGMPLPLGAIDNRRSLVGIDNLVSFLKLVLEHPDAAGERFLVSDDDDISTTRLLDILRVELKSRSWLVPLPQGLTVLLLGLMGKARAADRLCGSLQVNISKAKTRLGWRPPVPLEGGLKAAARDFLLEKGL